ncbi:uncharacterized protein TNCV_1427021 [Trichonephila clavipes]|nr:uncharacterized protein TNCV_1427021 [Trichonephila clavipes]
MLEVTANFSQRVQNLEKKLLACEKTMNVKTTNGWTEWVKACKLAASVRGDASEVLQYLPDTKRLHLNSLYHALDLRLGQKYSKDYARLQMKTRHQKNGEILQKYASEIERLANLAFSDHPVTVRGKIR